MAVNPLECPRDLPHPRGWLQGGCCDGTKGGAQSHPSLPILTWRYHPKEVLGTSLAWGLHQEMLEELSHSQCLLFAERAWS